MADKPAAMETPAAAKTAPEVTWRKGVRRFFYGLEGGLFPTYKNRYVRMFFSGC